MVHKLRLLFIFLNDWTKFKRRTIYHANDTMHLFWRNISWHLKIESIISVSTKFYWNTATLTLLHFVYVCFHDTTAEVNGCYWDCMAQKAWNIYYLALHRKKIIVNLWPRGARKALWLTYVLNQILKNKVELILVEWWWGWFSRKEQAKHSMRKTHGLFRRWWTHGLLG